MVDQRLTGQIQLEDGKSGTTLTVEQQVKQVYLDATNKENLFKMYVGWAAWL